MIRIVLGWKGRKPNNKSEDPKVLFCGHSKTEAIEARDKAIAGGKFGVVGVQAGITPHYKRPASKEQLAASKAHAEEEAKATAEAETPKPSSGNKAETK